MTHPRDEVRAIVRSMRLLVSDAREAGVADLPGIAAPPVETPPAPPPRAAARVAAPAPRATPPAPRPAPAFQPRVAPLALPADALASFGDLPARVAACTKCALCKGRMQTVFGEGAAPARLVFCGEGPGFEEDKSGRPFVGPAGELLTDMIVKGMKMRREDVFILNAVKCRPPGNRTPLPEEIAACRPFLDEQLALLRPDVIVALGNPACQALLGKVGITKLRGQVFVAHGTKIVPTYHPSYLLRNERAHPSWSEAWSDLKLVMRLLAPPPVPA